MVIAGSSLNVAKCLVSVLWFGSLLQVVFGRWLIDGYPNVSTFITKGVCDGSELVMLQAGLAAGDKY